VRVLTVRIATAEETDAVPSGDPPSRKVTVPVIAEAEIGGVARLAVTVTVWDWTAGFGCAARVMFGVAGVTVSRTAAEVLEEKAGVAAKAELNEYVPWGRATVSTAEPFASRAALPMTLPLARNATLGEVQVGLQAGVETRADEGERVTDVRVMVLKAVTEGGGLTVSEVVVELMRTVSVTVLEVLELRVVLPA